MGILLGSMVFFSSCLETTKSEVTPYAAITSIQLGNFEVKIHDLNSKRRDTILYATHSGAMYPMTIDQINNTIYNLDSVMKGANLTKVTSNTITANGYVFYKDKTMELFEQWQKSDSINFSDSVFFKVVSTDGSWTRTYTMLVNVHQTYPDSMTWTKADDYCWRGMSVLSSAVKDNNIYVFGYSSPDITVAANDIRTGSRVMESTKVQGIPDYTWSGRVSVFAGRLYTVANGSLYTSDNGVDWTDTAIPMKSLLQPGSSVSRMWAVGTDGKLKTSEDMATWTDFCDVPSEFPDSVANIVQYATASNPGTDRLLVMGYDSDKTTVKVWTMLSGDTCWTYMEPGFRTQVMTAKMSLHMFRYDGSLYACGDVLDGFYQSQDNGINWRYCDSYVEEYDSWNQYMQVPAPLKDQLAPVCCSVDVNGYIWICDSFGNLWRGIINRKMN